MAKVMSKTSKEVQNKVWIEIERSKDTNKNHERAKLLTNLVRRLGSKGEVWYSEHDECFNYAFDESGTYVSLTDNGHWFALDFFGRD